MLVFTVQFILYFVKPFTIWEFMLTHQYTNSHCCICRGTTWFCLHKHQVLYPVVQRLGQICFLFLWDLLDLPLVETLLQVKTSKAFILLNKWRLMTLLVKNNYPNLKNFLYTWWRNNMNFCFHKETLSGSKTYLVGPM